MQYKSVVCGGTFDGLHLGHQALLRKAFEVSENVTIGLTSDEYIVKFKYERSHFNNPERNIRLYKDRFYDLINWLESERVRHRASIFTIDDPYGPTVPGAVTTPGDYQAIIVSSNTKVTAEQINVLRARVGWPPFEIVEIQMVMAEDGKPIASERIRDGEIDVKGHLVLPDELRPEMQKPLGYLLVRESDLREHIRGNIQKAIITVGDVATKKLVDMSIMPTLAVIDLCVGRRPFQTLEAYQFPPDVIINKVVSGPGYISKEAIEAIHKWSVQKPRNAVIVVEGEEDLLVLPVVLYAPNGSVVYYGQPKAGMVAIDVTEKKRQEAQKLLDQFVK